MRIRASELRMLREVVRITTELSPLELQHILPDLERIAADQATPIEFKADLCAAVQRAERGRLSLH